MRRGELFPGETFTAPISLELWEVGLVLEEVESEVVSSHIVVCVETSLFLGFHLRESAHFPGAFLFAEAWILWVGAISDSAPTQSIPTVCTCCSTCRTRKGE